MAIPDFIKALRSKIGTDLLQVPTVSVMAYDDRGRLLLAKDKSSGFWGLPSGIIDPHELPADAAMRETWEEAGVFVELTHILGVFAGEQFSGVYSNGDQVAVVATVFAARVIRGTPRPDHEETSDAGFFLPPEIDNLPCYPHFQVVRISLSHGPRRPTSNLLSGSPAVTEGEKTASGVTFHSECNGSVLPEMPANERFYRGEVAVGQIFEALLTV